jgi:hypothetical protein
MGHQYEEPRLPDFVTGVLEDFSEFFRLRAWTPGPRFDKQDGGQALTAAERREAEGLVEEAEFLSLLKLRARVTSAKRA